LAFSSTSAVTGASGVASVGQERGFGDGSAEIACWNELASSLVAAVLDPVTFGNISVVTLFIGTDDAVTTSGGDDDGRSGGSGRSGDD